jgi:hypothetical protein
MSKSVCFWPRSPTSTQSEALICALWCGVLYAHLLAQGWGVSWGVIAIKSLIPHALVGCELGCELGCAPHFMGVSGSCGVVVRWQPTPRSTGQLMSKLSMKLNVLVEGVVVVEHTLG